MSSNLLDPEAILSGSEEWAQLEEKWGEPVDLDTEDDVPSKIKPVFSTLDLLKTTFDSPFILKKVQRNIENQPSDAILDYKNFIQNLRGPESQKQLYLMNKQKISAVSIEEICAKIDEIFKSVEKLCSATSTLRKKLPEVVNCSISADGLSFDDTVLESMNNESVDVDKCIDEAFDKLSQISIVFSTEDDATKETVTTLVKKFSSMLNDTVRKCHPRRKRQCCNKFKELSEFWNNRAFDQDF